MYYLKTTFASEVKHYEEVGNINFKLFLKHYLIIVWHWGDFQLRFYT